ncbi:glyoxylase-like metal-dependent hydrolase (beta-lactamase superfamily II) [Arthrobacter sp. UYEF21]
MFEDRRFELGRGKAFSGDLGRPDLLDEAAGGVDTRFGGAKQLFASLRDKFLTLPDYVQVHPAHGAGSACGKALGAIPSSTVGYERLYAWWGPYLATNDEQGFIDELLDGQPDAHAYFGRMKRENRKGPAVMGERAPLPELDTADVAGTWPRTPSPSSTRVPTAKSTRARWSGH